MKKIISLLLLLSLICSLFACGEYNPATNVPSGDNSGKLPSGAVDQPTLDDDPTNDFTVRLRLNGEAFIPSVAVNVYWNDGYSIHIAPMDKNGVATIDGLDGDYKVTLSSSPSGYSYDPNAYTATNDSRHVIIDMYDSGSVNAKESALYSCHRITTTGVYTVTINEDVLDVNEDGKFVDVAYFEFAPQTNGVYTIESWVNTADDDINPVCIAYLGSSAYKYGPYEVTDVGACGSYTRNFVHTIRIADENISSGGSQVFTFGITAETKSGVYPATYTFAVKRDGGFDHNRPAKTMVVPKHDWSGFDFEAFNALAGGERQGAATLYHGTTDSYVFAEYDYEANKYNYKVWEKEDGGDGVYHVYDEEKYSETGGYGPVLFAYISGDLPYISSSSNKVSLVTIEDAGNNALIVNNATENYRQFIKGFDMVASTGFYCVSNCPCHLGEGEGTPSACPPGCGSCLSYCSPCPEELIGKAGYTQWCNEDGVAPVTPELKEFLQKFAISSQYFADGEGFVDSNGVYAYEDAQWLFACGYYK